MSQVTGKEREEGTPHREASGKPGTGPLLPCVQLAVGSQPSLLFPCPTHTDPSIAWAPQGYHTTEAISGFRIQMIPMG